jgi:chromosome partitioning protein
MVAIQKGGVGKTTSTVIMADILAGAGYKVLLVDLDSQGNATQMVTQKSIYENSGNTVLEAIKEKRPDRYIIRAKENLDLLPADDMLVTFSRYIYTEKVQNPIRELDNTLRLVESEYDYILMDCPPNLGDLVLNAIVCSDHIMIPVMPDAFGMDALDRFVDNIKEAKGNGHTRAEIAGIILTCRDMRNALERSVEENIRSRYGSMVFDTVIRRRAKLKEFALTGTSMRYKKEAEALEDYIELVKEMVERVE